MISAREYIIERGRGRWRWRWNRRGRWIYLSRETVEESKPELSVLEDDILVERIQDQFGYSSVRPTSMNQQQPLKESTMEEKERKKINIDIDKE